MRSSTKIRTRGRPRKFDSNVAIEAAKNAFLRKGYSNTTLDELSTAMGINRPSLYGAFTDKETLYQKALETYAGKMALLFRDSLEGEPDLHKALRKLYAVALDAYYTRDGEAVGCMVACTAVTEAVDNPAILQQTKSVIEGIDELVARRVARAITDKQLPKNTNVRLYSRLVVGVLHSLAIRCRAGASRKILDEIATESAALLTSRIAR